MTTDFTNTKVYSISPARQRILRSLIGGLLLLPLSLAALGLFLDDTAATATGFLWFAFTAPVVLIPILALRATRLTVSNRGIEIRELGSRASIPWEAIESVRLTASSTGLVLRQPSPERWATRLGDWAGVTFQGSSFYTSAELQLIAERRWLPLKPFAWWLVHGPLRQDISRYAPHLAQHVEAQLPSYAAGRKENRRIIGRALIVSGLLSVATVLVALLPWDWTMAHSAVSRQVFERLELVAGWSFAVLLSVYAVANLRAACSSLRTHRWGHGTLWGLMAIIQAGMAAAIL